MKSARIKGSWTKVAIAVAMSCACMPFGCGARSQIEGESGEANTTSTETTSSETNTTTTTPGQGGSGTTTTGQSGSGGAGGIPGEPCGNGVLQPDLGEECDDGANNGGPCSLTCKAQLDRKTEEQSASDNSKKESITHRLKVIEGNFIEEASTGEFNHYRFRP